VFGQFYHQHDVGVSGDGHQALSRDTYACLLLAELLDRVAVLAAIRRVHGRSRKPGVMTQALDVFLRDAEEARARGLRARLFCRTETGVLDPWSVDPADELHDLGGALVAADGLGPSTSVRI
jgi:hypothetical protein